MFIPLLIGCGSETKHTDLESIETPNEETQEIDLTKLLNTVNNSVISHCGSEYILTPFIQYRLPDGTLTDDLSLVDKNSLENHLLTVYVMFQISKEGNKLEDMVTQHYIEAVVDVSIFEVVSLFETDSSIESEHWKKIF